MYFLFYNSNLFVGVRLKQSYHQALHEYRFDVNIGRGVNIDCDSVD